MHIWEDRAQTADQLCAPSEALQPGEVHLGRAVPPVREVTECSRDVGALLDDLHLFFFTLIGKETGEGKPAFTL